jgi:1,4-alpha-glucan branching enzyme
MSSEGRVGDLAVVLHSHMPYVEGFGTYPFGEEWLFDAVIRSYVPVLEVADQVTVTVTPVLADQLEAQGVAERMLAFLREYRIGSAALDVEDVDEPLKAACAAEAERYRQALARLEPLAGDPLALVREPEREGRIELMASAATHAVLPLLATDGARRLQVDAGLRSHRRRFGEPEGFWLPECAYEPGVESLLAERGLEYFCTDQSEHEPAQDALRPVAAAAGTVGFTIDWEAIQWLWSLDGYPSDPAFADFHRKSLRGARPWRIDGEPYDPGLGQRRAAELGSDFAASAAERLERYRGDRDRPGLIVFAIDTELLGHWWWEGPTWLESLIAAAPEHGVELVTLGEARRRHEPETRPLQRSTWGEDKDLRTWDSPEVADLAWAARRLELRVMRALRSGLGGPAAERATRELLALQASDWAFLDRRRQAGDYPWQRTTDHARALLESLHAGGHPPAPGLRNLAPDLSLAPLLQA